MVVVSSRANIALVKYWGKRSVELNLPAAGSLSVTLSALETRTRVELTDNSQDSLQLDGQVAGDKATRRISAFLDQVRRMAGRSERALVVSKNSFPTAAGLASSASAFAALAYATSEAYGLHLEPKALSVLARTGSGSAARSIFGGFVRMYAGAQADGQDAFAVPISDAQIPLVAVIAVVDAGSKKIGSTDGMERTRLTSPYHAAWLKQVELDLKSCETALKTGDFEQLAAVVEGSCLAMHADAMAARPGVIYFQGATLWAIDQVRSLRAEGVPVCFTVDAGPHLVAFTLKDHVERVGSVLQEHPDVARVLVSDRGEGVRIEEAF